MRHFNPSEHPVPFVHRLLLGGVAPRPIALVASMDAEQRLNLSPFSFFNAFGANPPIIVVSPAYRGKDGTPKHTFGNILTTREFTVSAVTWDMVEQISLASSDYPAGVDEFVKAGFTPLASTLVATPGVAESPFVMECRLLQHIDTGAQPGSGNLLVAEVLMFHVRESVLDGDRIDPRRMDLVARMGGDWYCRANGEALFELPKPSHNGIGMDALPEHLRNSVILTGNDLAGLAGVAALPDVEAIRKRWHQDLDRMYVDQHSADMFDVELRAGNPRGALLCLLKDWKAGRLDETHRHTRLLHCTRAFLAEGDIDLAWECALMSAERFQ
jgi:flavin reductase (DIM6/NTAB) family NADH-FMN oxidoreductase RutF